MVKKYFISLVVSLNLLLIGCSTETDEQVDINDSNTNDEQDVVDDTVEDIPTNDNESELKLMTHSTETVSRVIEGMNEDVDVSNYEIQPFNIVYQLDEEFESPKVDENKITYVTEDNNYNITLEIVEETDLDEATEDLQKQYENEQYEMVGELQSTPTTENDLKGKMQFFAYPDVNGFYVYEISEGVLKITYSYPSEAGDGMEPLLEHLRKSIEVKK